MEKIICEICGTSYPETEGNCPVCGCSRDFSLDDFADEDLLEGASVSAAGGIPGGKKKNKEIFDFDEVNQDRPARRRPKPEDYDEDEEEEEEEEESGSNVFLVVILVILIVLLLLTAGFFFVRYFLPNMTDKAAQTDPVVTTAALQTEPVETTDPGIPCTDIVIPGGKVELGKDGLWLLNVQVYPENTTDVLQYVSADEAVATVSEGGTVTAVGEGTTEITITCGEKQIICNVTVDYSVAEETAGQEELPAPQAEEQTQPAEADTQPEETTEATEAPEETSEAGQELKLKKTDISIFSNYTSVKLELDCDIAPEDMTWFTMDSTVAIVHDGVVTSTGSGMTRIYGEYGGQQVECIVRCPF